MNGQPEGQRCRLRAEAVLVRPSWSVGKNVSELASSRKILSVALGWG